MPSDNDYRAMAGLPELPAPPPDPRIPDLPEPRKREVTVGGLLQSVDRMGAGYMALNGYQRDAAEREEPVEPAWTVVAARGEMARVLARFLEICDDEEEGKEADDRRLERLAAAMLRVTAKAHPHPDGGPGLHPQYYGSAARRIRQQLRGNFEIQLKDRGPHPETEETTAP